MIPTVLMALIAILASPCTAYPTHNNIPKRVFPVPPRYHGQGHAIPPMPFPLHHDKSPPPPAQPTSTVPPTVHNPQLPPRSLPIRTHPEFPYPFPRNPIPRPRLPLSPPSVSGVPLTPTVSPTNPTALPPAVSYVTEPIDAVTPAQPPKAPHHRFPPSPPHRLFPPQHRFPPQRRFPPQHQFPPHGPPFGRVPDHV